MRETGGGYPAPAASRDTTALSIFRGSIRRFGTYPFVITRFSPESSSAVIAQEGDTIRAYAPSSQDPCACSSSTTSNSRRDVGIGQNYFKIGVGEMKRRMTALLFLGIVMAGAAADRPVSDAAAAINKGRAVCRLQQPTSPSSGRWQAVLVRNANFGDEWHVWFGTLPEPFCGFAGALVKADGAYTGCAVTVCKNTSSKSHSGAPNGH